MGSSPDGTATPREDAMIKISAELPPEMLERINAIVQTSGDSRNAVIRKLLAQALAGHEAP